MFANSDLHCLVRLHPLTVPLSVPLPLLFISDFFGPHLAGYGGQLLKLSAKLAPPPCLLCQWLVLLSLPQGGGPWAGAHGRRGPWHGPSVCPQPALCTDQVRRADWSPALRAPLAFPWQLYSQALGSCWAESPGAPQVPTVPGRSASVWRLEVGNTHLP